MFISDNGASAEGGPTGSVNENKFFNNVPDSIWSRNLAMIDQLGGPTTFNHYAWGWTFAGNTRRSALVEKRETYRGGISDPFIRPLAEKASGERARCAHFALCPCHRRSSDSAPKRSASRMPNVDQGVTQSPIEGHSFAHVLDNAEAMTRHITQYFTR